MGEESVDLRKEIAQAKEQINSPDDALADIAIKVQATESSDRTSYVGERKTKD